MQKLFVVFLLFGSVSSLFAQTAQKDISVVLDNWWTIDYVKNGCEMHPCPTMRTAEEVVRDFENELDIAFASENACHGVKLIRFTPEMAKAAVKNPNAPATGAMAESSAAGWQLMFDLDGRSHTQAGQGWSLVGPAQQTFNGRISNTQRFVRQVCKIVKGVGGKMK
jgi:hypothetical protein